MSAKSEKINRFGSQNRVSIFWSGLASAHYAKKSIEWLEAENIRFVPKTLNPPNVPKARPIEDFWGILSSKVYAGGWEAKSVTQLIRRIRLKVKEVDMALMTRMMNDVEEKLSKIAESGPFAVI